MSSVTLNYFWDVAAIIIPKKIKSGHVPGTRLSLVFLDHSSNTL